MTIYDFKTCSGCHKERECKYIVSNVIPWLCEDCCPSYNEFWSDEEEEEFYKRD